jgi:hypothetical protein
MSKVKHSSAWVQILVALIGVFGAAAVAYISLMVKAGVSQEAPPVDAKASADPERNTPVHPPKTPANAAPAVPAVNAAKESNSVPAPADSLDPQGSPASVLPKLPKRYFVWRDAGGWHLRFTTGQIKYRFNGEVRAEGGDIVKVSGVEDPANEKEWWEVTEGGRALKFDKSLKQGLDGFDFKVSKAVWRVGFDLRVSGRQEPQFIFVGCHSQNPKSVQFELSNLD